jgi:glycosyltransferase involved in cell wall biosynthesis
MSDRDRPGRAAAGPRERARVLHVMGWPSVQYGSFERHLVAVARRCGEAGVVNHFAFAARPASPDFIRDAPAPIHILPSARHPADPRFALGLWRLLQRLRPTHLHAHHGIDAYHSLAVARLAGVPGRFFTKHNTRSAPVTRGARLRHQWLGAQCQLVFAVSQMACDSLAELGIPARKIRRIYQGVDCAAYRPDPARRAALRQSLGVGPADRVLISSSHLRPEKGIEMLPALTAALAVPGGRVMTIVLGEGELRAEIEGRAAALGLGPDRFRLLGRRLDVPDWLAAADLFVFTTTGRKEGFSSVVWEAAAAGVPAVVSQSITDFAEAFGDTVTFYPPGDEAALLARCRALLADPGLAERRAAAARDVVQRRFSREAGAETYLSAYLSVPAA